MFVFICFVKRLVCKLETMGKVCYSPEILVKLLSSLLMLMILLLLQVCLCVRPGREICWSVLLIYVQLPEEAIENLKAEALDEILLFPIRCEIIIEHGKTAGWVWRDVGSVQCTKRRVIQSYYDHKNDLYSQKGLLVNSSAFLLA